MFLKGASKAHRLLILASISMLGCGGRSEVPRGDGTGPLIPCNTDAECFDGNLCVTKTCQSGFCTTISSVACDDGNVCTADICEPTTGNCTFPSRVADTDGDGYLGALPGTQPGTLGSCGNDCNDSAANVHPGATEVCDGVDNNCDGNIDEGINQYNPIGTPIRISDGSFMMGGASGLTFTGNLFGVTWTGEQSNKRYQGYFSSFNRYGTPQSSTTNTSQTSNDSFGGPLLWSGSAFATAWEVRAEKGYDIFFNQLDINGKKLGPDVRISESAGFSIQPSLLWDGTNYWVAWSDDNAGDLFRIFGRKVAPNGTFVGDSHALTDLISDARSPILLRSPTAYLLVYLSASNQRLSAQLLSNDMTPSGTSVFLSDSGANDYTADWVGDRFVVAWSVERDTVGSAIWAATLDIAGKIIRAAQPITMGASFSRTPNIASLGDRFALAWADDRLSFGHYGIRLGIYAADFTALSPVTTLVESQFDCVDPGLAAGGSGLALVYRERTNGDVGQPYFLPLACATFL